MLALVIIISIYEMNCVFSKCCKMKSGEKTGLIDSDSCGKFTEISACLAEENIDTCDWDWVCFLTKAAKQPSKPKTKLPKTKTGETEPVPLPQYVYSKSELEALSKITTASDYYSSYQLLTADASGDAVLYDFDPSFIKYLKERESAESSAKKRRLITNELQTDNRIDIFGDELSGNVNNARRRLSVGREANVATRTSRDPPYSSVGILELDMIGKGSGLCTATVINSVDEGTAARHKWFDYILTAGHCCWDVTRVDEEEHDLYRYERLAFNINFYRGANTRGDFADLGAPTHTYARLHRLWVPLYKDVPLSHYGEDVLAAHANDFCVLKYSVDAQSPHSRVIGRRERESRMRMITYRMTPGREQRFHMRMIPNIVPDDTGHVTGGLIYSIDPAVFPKGMSGSSLFRETAGGVQNVAVGVCAGSNLEPGADERGIMMRITPYKARMINTIGELHAEYHYVPPRAYQLNSNMLREEDHIYDDFDDNMQYDARAKYGLYPLMIFASVCVFGFICLIIGYFYGFVSSCLVQKMWIQNRK